MTVHTGEPTRLGADASLRARRRWTFGAWLVGAALLLLGGIGMVALWGKSPVTLVGIQYGGSEPLVYQPTLWNSASSILRLVERDPWSGMKLPAPADPKTLGVWVRARRERPSMRPQYVAIFDEHGCEVMAGMGMALSNGLTRWDAPVFPRRGQTLGLRVYEQESDGTWRTKHELHFANPASGAHPTWPAQALPVIKQDGDLEFTLIALTPGVLPKGIIRYSRETYTRATFRVTRNGRIARGWRPDSLVISDATGNRWTPPYAARPFFVDGGDEHHVYLPQTLWADETAWKLQVEFSRGASSEFTPNELRVLKRVAVPSRGRILRGANTRSSPGGLALAAFAPPNMPPGEWRGSQWVPWLSTVVVKTDPPQPTERVALTRVTDDRGRVSTGPEISQLQPGRSWGKSAGVYGFGLRLPRGAKTVDLTFGMHHSRVVEFLATPTGSAKNTP